LVQKLKRLYLSVMKVVIFYKPESEHARLVEEFIHDFSKQYPDTSITLLDADSIDGGRQAEIYDIVSYPTVLALDSDGSTIQRWDNGQLPLKGDVAYYAK